MTDLSKIMEQAQQVQKNIQQAQMKIAQLKVKGEAGGKSGGPGGKALVTIVIDGRHKVSSIDIDSVVYKEDKDILSDLLIAAFNNAVDKIEEESRKQMMGLMQGMDLPEEMLGNFGGDESEED